MFRQSWRCCQTTDDLPSLLNDFHAREVLHVTFGSALAQFGVELKAALAKHEDAYYEGLKSHFEKHLSLLHLRATLQSRTGSSAVSLSGRLIRNEQ